MSGSRSGFTLLELVIVLTIIGILFAIAIPRAQLVLDGISVHAAADDVRSLLASARTLALAGRSAVAVDIGSAAGTLRIRRGPEVLMSRNVTELHGVEVGRTRDSLTYDPHGLGHGAANLSIILRRRAAVETVFVSRFGRVR
jgi:prepilin-type N-terminal cleavage/methylation domain-containing protein